MDFQEALTIGVETVMQKMEKFDQTTSQGLVKMFAKRKTAAATNALSTEILMFSNLVITSSKCVQWPECLD